MSTSPPGLFIVGTDTEVGKTYVTVRIAEQLREAGKRVGVYKPVASGCRQEKGQNSLSDAESLWVAAGKPADLKAVCPQQFQAPLAPPAAARAEGSTVDGQLLRTGVDHWKQCSDIILVEGVGGLMSPLTEEEFVADLAYDFGFPVVVVVPNQLGVINQTLQTLITAFTFREGIPVAGIVLNHCRSPETADISCSTNREAINRHAVPPVLAEVPWQGSFDVVVDWWSLATSRNG
ncbi:MAG TPA: dethiobiotin synthase [Planctomycetaceae bacterium]|nr:dethiobiotin synthase [Planctomycetaceae bacterium]